MSIATRLPSDGEFVVLGNFEDSPDAVIFRDKSNTSVVINAPSGDTVRVGVGDTDVMDVAGAGVTIAGTTTLNSVEYTWPGDNGDAGEQLQTDGSGTLSWAAAGSLERFKNILGQLDSGKALERLLGASVVRFQYKPDGEMNTGDFNTEYAGILGEELPEVMHHEGKVFSPVSAFGFTVAAFQAMAERITQLEAKLAQQE